LLAVGALTTIPLAANVLLGHEEYAATPAITPPANRRAGMMAAQ